MTERIRDPRLARRRARVLISDLVVYAADQVRIGLEKDDLFDRLQAEIARARAYYEQTVDPTLPDRDRIFHHALVDVLVLGSRRIATHVF